MQAQSHNGKLAFNLIETSVMKNFNVSGHQVKDGIKKRVFKETKTMEVIIGKISL